MQPVYAQAQRSGAKIRYSKNSALIARQIAEAEGPAAAIPDGSTALVSQSGHPLTLSPGTLDIAQRLGFLEEIKQFDALRDRDAAAGIPTLELLNVRQELLETVLTLGYETNTFAHRVDADIARANAIGAILAQKRNRAILLNSLGDLLSGGVTGVISGALEVANVNKLSADTIDTAEGAVQSGLAIIALKQQQGEKRVEQGIPNILARLINEDHSTKILYPESVWIYLNSPPYGSKDGKTRRQMMVDKWMSCGFCLNRKRLFRLSPDKRAALIVGTHAHDFRVTSDLVEDRMAMLTELRATATQLDNNLLEVIEYLRATMRASFKKK